MGYTISAAYAELFESFLAYEEQRVSRQGYETLLKMTRRLLRWFEEEEINLEDVSVRDALRYRNSVSGHVKKDGGSLSVGSIHNHLKAGKRFFAYLVEKELRKTNPFEDVAYPRLPEHVSRNVLSEVQMGYLLETLKAFDQVEGERRQLRRYRLHVAAEFLYATGLRIAEAASLVPENIDTGSRLVYVPEGKGQKARIAFMTCFASEVMEQYLKEGRKAVLGSYGRKYGHTVFGANHGRFMAVINEELKEVCQSLELPVITSHGFRHSLGTHLLHAGCDMRYIQVILGHESLGTTQVYTRVDKDDLKNSLDMYHPRKWRTG